MDNELTIILGAIGSFFMAIGGVAAERWRAKREQKSADQQASNDTWTRTKDLFAEKQRQIDELRNDLKASDAARDAADADRDRERDECTKRVEEVRADLKAQMHKERVGWQEDFDRLSGKYREVLKICADQEEEIQHSRIVIAKINQRRTDPVPPPPPAPLIGGRRPYDQPPPGTATVTVTMPAVPGQSPVVTDSRHDDGAATERLP